MGTHRALTISLCVLALVLLVLVVMQVMLSVRDAAEAETAAAGNAFAAGRALPLPNAGAQTLYNVATLEELQALIQSTPNLIVMFHATFCGACHAAMPDVVATQVNCSAKVVGIESAVLGGDGGVKWQITAFPTFVRFAGGVETARMLGGGRPRIQQFFAGTTTTTN